MKIFLFWDSELEEIWYYVSESGQGEPILVKPISKKEGKDEVPRQNSQGKGRKKRLVH